MNKSLLWFLLSVFCQFLTFFSGSSFLYICAIHLIYHKFSTWLVYTENFTSYCVQVFHFFVEFCNNHIVIFHYYFPLNQHFMKRNITCNFFTAIYFFFLFFQLGIILQICCIYSWFFFLLLDQAFLISFDLVVNSSVYLPRWWKK